MGWPSYMSIAPIPSLHAYVSMMNDLDKLDKANTKVEVIAKLSFSKAS